LADREDPVVLIVPRDGPAMSAMRVITGWVASRHDLALDQLDDIDLALETVLAGEHAPGEPLSLTITVLSGEIHLLIGGLTNQALRSNLEIGCQFQPTREWPLDVRLFLSAFVDAYTLIDRDGASFSISMQKRIA
jgi:hypothetical protein